jgi:glycosyltransferase involved in cell wall biosynthesis
MSIVIFGDIFSFPEGNAATNRVYTYARGFKDNNINVHVICFANEYRNEQEGLVNGISFYYPFKQGERNKYFVVRRWQKLLKYYRTLLLIAKINKQDKILAINVWTNLHLTHMFAWFLARIFNTKLITECSEHPLRHYQKDLWSRKQGIIKFYIESRLCDGVLCISNYLINFYKKSGIDERKLFLVPSTVDPARFLKTGSPPLNYRYIGYFGSLTFKRDNVDLLIKAFARIANLYPEFHLVLGGICTEHEKKDINELISQLNIKLKVEFLDYLSRQEIARYINHADVLVMVRSEDLQSQASYPSKLTEFLATSKPVVTVNVGEISDYLTDGLNAFLVEPGNSELLAEKLDYVIRNYALARQVGQNGKELTDTIFNYNFQAKRMIGFIDSLNNVKN